MISLRISGFIALVGLVFFSSLLQAQNPALVGYWQNWNNPASPYLPLDEIDSRYNVVMVAFAVPADGTTYDMTFSPNNTTQSQLISQIQTLKSQGKRVGISIGGGGTLVKINTQTEQNIFVASMLSIINTYGFNAMDLDLESGSLTISGGTIANPTDIHIIRMINATKSIMSGYRATHANQKLFLTMAPETAHTIGGQSAWSGVWGAYLPVVHALRDSLDIMMVQLYNSGSMYAVTGDIYSQGTADFIVALVEAMIVGFNVDRWNNQAGPFVGLPANKVAVALPACPDAAGSGYTSPVVVKSAIDYLRGIGPKPGAYTRISPTGYPNLRGMMTWSINWDAVSTCGSVYEYAASFTNIFPGALPVALTRFEARYDKEYRQTQLEWETGQTSNFSHFEVQHSLNGYDFETIGTIQKHDASQSGQAYRFAHVGPAAGLHHYRLRSIDLDGRFAFSEIVSVQVDSLSGIVVYPNPFVQHLFIDAGEVSGGQIMLYDAVGRLILEKEMETGTNEIDMGQHPAGVYLLVCIQPDRVVAKQVVKH